MISKNLGVNFNHQIDNHTYAKEYKEQITNTNYLLKRIF